MISTRKFHATTLLFLAATCVTAAAEDQTIGFRLIVHTIEAKVLQAPGPEGRIIGVQDAKGSAVFDDGRLADKTFVYSFDLDKGVGSGHGYSVYSFVDGSSITASFEATTNADGTTGVYTVIGGTGEFAGAEGTGSFASEENAWEDAGLYKGEFALKLP